MSDQRPPPMYIGNPQPPDLQQRMSGRSEDDDTAGDRAYGTPPVANIPPRAFGSPRPQSTVPNYGSIPQRPPFNPASVAASGAATPMPNAADADEADRARVVRRHLVAAEERSLASRRSSVGGLSMARPPFLTRRPSSDAASANANPGPDADEPFPIPYGSVGGDVTHSIYKWHAEQGRGNLRRPRSVSFAGPQLNADPAFQHIHEPGGFRRNYLVLAAREQGQEDPRMLHNFIEFLYLYGHFAGEDLEEEDEEAVTPPLDEEHGPFPSTSAVANDQPESQLIHRSVASLSRSTERAPLLSRSMSRASVRRRRRMSIGSHGDATVTQAVLMLLKAFVGTGVLFLGKAFYNGGMLFSIVVMVLIALVSLWSFILLVQTKFAVSGSFGDIGGVLYGNWMRQLILSSIVISQLGFVSAYLIFVAENLQAFILGVSKCTQLVSTTKLIFAQLVIFLPLAMIRNLAKLSTTALVADAFILIGLVYLFGMEGSLIADRGVADIKWFNERNFPLLIGTAVFSFEGIGLIIPITDAMREPHKFPKVLTGVMIFLIVLFGGAGALAYAAFGSSIDAVVLKNLPQDSKPVQAVQFLYSLAILLSTPLQLFPALRILETALFVKSGKLDVKIKWTKNVFRTVTVFGCASLAAFGAKDLDKFVSFIGSCACVPLCFVYPAMLHYKGAARTRFQKGSDIALMFFGILAAFYTSIQTIKLMVQPNESRDTIQCTSPSPGSGKGPGSPFWLQLLSKL